MIVRIEGVVRRLFLLQSCRYLIVGGFCAALHNMIVIAIARAAIGYPIALVASFCITTPIGYLLHSAFTFEETRSWNRLRRFLLASVASFCGSAALMALLCTGLRMPVIIATPITTAILFLWNFTSARWSILLCR